MNARTAEQAREVESMYVREDGSKCAQTKELNIVQIATLVRADIKALSSELPKGLKASVRVKKYSGGQAIDVTVTALPMGFVECRPEWAPGEGTGRYSEETKQVIGSLKSILDAYNFDGSHIQSDYFHVRFYGSVSVELPKAGEL